MDRSHVLNQYELRVLILCERDTCLIECELISSYELELRYRNSKFGQIFLARNAAAQD